MQNKNKKSFNKKYIIAAAGMLLLITPALVFMLLRPEYDPASEAAIRKAVADQLFTQMNITKDPNKLTDEDFGKIAVFSIGQPQTIVPLYNPTVSINYATNELSDIRLLAKFGNLQKLNLGKINVPVDKIPQWVKILAKLGVYDINRRYTIDLSPLEKLVHLEELQLGGAAVRDIQPLAKLNLKHLLLIDSPVTDIRPLLSLNQLQNLEIMFCPNIKRKDLEDLLNAHPNLRLSGTLNLNK